MAKALEILRDRLTEDSLELSYDNIEGIETLRLVLNALGEDEDGIAVLELSEIPVEEEEKACYYHFMTVLANRLEDAQIPSTLVNLNMLNMETLIGAYQIVPESGTVVHKYVLRLSENQEEKAADELYSCLVDVAAIVNNDYERVLSSIE